MPTTTDVIINQIDYVSTNFGTSTIKTIPKVNNSLVFTRIIYDKLECYASISVTVLTVVTNYSVNLITILAEWTTYYNANPIPKAIELYTISEMLNEYFTLGIGTFIDLGKLESVVFGYSYLIPSKVAMFTEKGVDIAVTSKSYKYDVANSTDVCSVNGVVHRTTPSSTTNGELIIKDAVSTIKKLKTSSVSSLSFSALGEVSTVDISSNNMVSVSQNNPTDVIMLDLSSALGVLNTTLTNKTVILSFMGVLFYIDNYILSTQGPTSVVLDTTRMELPFLIEEVTSVLTDTLGLTNPGNSISLFISTSLPVLHHILDMSQTFLIVIDTPGIKIVKSNIRMGMTRNKIKKNKNLIYFPKRRLNSNLLADVKITPSETGSKTFYTYAVEPYRGKNGISTIGYVNPTPVDANSLSFDEMYRLTHVA